MQLKIEMNLQMEASLQYNSSYNEGFGGIQDRFDSFATRFDCKYSMLLTHT
jgi:hypothetical protein